MRFLKELFNPKLKCKRLGHKERRPIHYRIIREGNRCWKIYKATFMTCPRCGDSPEQPDEEEQHEWCNSLSAPHRVFEEINSRGYAILSRWIN
jgi:hypothetical protein